jgi:hypothetical protein
MYCSLFVIFFSDDSDEPSCAVKHLPSRLLLSMVTKGEKEEVCHRLQDETPRGR